MTEVEWLTVTDPTPILEFLEGKDSERKLRLFGCGCCYRIRERRFASVETIHLLKPIERFADGLCTSAELESMRMAQLLANQFLKWGNSLHPVFNAERAVQRLWPVLQVEEVTRQTIELAGYEAFARVAESNSQKRSYRWWKRGPKLSQVEVRDAETEGITAERAICCTSLRDIFGNPFRPVSLDPSWLTSTVLALAEGIYDERAFDRLPILADALQDAGCDNDDILNHCRSDKPHVRGCWPVDLILGKS
jgi:hypothetical protein